MANEGFAGQATGGAATSGLDSSVKLTFNRASIRYDNPFLDMTSTYIPVTIKGMMRFTALFALSDGLISQCISKMSEYPITKLIYNDEEIGRLKDDETTEWWKDILEKRINIMRILKESGMDYYAYGNSLISVGFPFRRQLQCPKCKEWHDATALNSKFRSYRYYAKCMKCKYEGKMDARDLKTKEPSGIKIIKWDLSHIDIKYNNISGDHFYYYTPPDNIRNAVRRGDLDIVNTTRLEIIEAIRLNKQLKLSSDNVYHQKRSAPQYLIPGERGWGIPAIMPVMKDIFHVKVLKKGNEMIAFDHIVPLRILFPAAQGDVSPHLTTNLSNWKTNVENQLLKHRADPNYVAIVPMPIGTQSFGGDGKILMIHPEIKAVEDDIITGMGVIPEIIRGGASWSGSNVSLRIIENTFINHRNDMQNIMDFVVEKIALAYDKKKIPIRMSDFKMADDLQKKQMIVNAAMGSPSEAMISRDTAIKEIGFDPHKEYQNNQEYLKKLIDIKTKESEGMAEARGAGSVVDALFNADAQMENQKRIEMHQSNIASERQKESEHFKEQNAQATNQDIANQGVQGVDVAKLIYIITARFAKLAETDKTEFKIRMLGMKQSMPNMYNEVFRNLQEMNLIAADLLPDLQLAQKETPGQIPQNTQGDVQATEAPSSAERTSVQNVASVNSKIVAVPEQKPPRSSNSGI